MTPVDGRLEGMLLALAEKYPDLSADRLLALAEGVLADLDARSVAASAPPTEPHIQVLSDDGIWICSACWKDWPCPVAPLPAAPKEDK